VVQGGILPMVNT